MEVRFVVPELRRLDEISSEVIACSLFEDERPPHGAVSLLDWRLGGCISRLLLSGYLTGQEGEACMVATRHKLPFDKAILFGLGARAAFDEVRFQRALSRMLAVMRGLCARSAIVELPGRHVGGLGPERATDLLFEIAEGHPEHDSFTLIESTDRQRRIMAHLSEQRRRDRRIILGETPPADAAAD